MAHHYTEAGLIEQAIPYWQQAGRAASQRSANVEAIAHLTKGLELLKTLPDTPERAQQELTLQLALGTAVDSYQRLCSPGSGKKSTLGRGNCASRWERPLSSSQYCGGLLRFIMRGRSSRRRASLAEQLLAV